MNMLYHIAVMDCEHEVIDLVGNNYAGKIEVNVQMLADGS